MNNISQELATLASSIKNQKEREYFLVHSERYRYTLRQIDALRLPKNAKILDIGSYPLHLFSILESRGYVMQGIASHHESVRKQNIAVCNIEKEPLPFPDGQFDAVLFFEVMEHLLFDPSVYLKEFFRVLVPGGKLLVTTPNAVHIKNRLRVLLGRNALFPLSQLYQAHAFEDLYYRHNREFVLSEVVDALVSNGFTIEKKERFSAYTPFRRRLNPENIIVKVVKIIGHLFTNLHPSLKDTIYIEAVRQL